MTHHDPHLTRATTYDFADSNIALFGSDIEKRVHEHQGDTEQAWDGAGVQPGLQIWRIEQFKVKPWPLEKYGTFYGGDSYIVLNTYKKDDKLLYNLHFWLGESTSQDEAGTAAYKTVELDDHLHGAPVQYREIEDHESTQFLSYFKKKFVTQKGGVATGFHHVSQVPPQDKPRLYRIGSPDTDKKNLFVREIPVKGSSLVQGDVFVLDLGEQGVLQLNTKSSSHHEKFRAAEFSRELLEGRHAGDVTVIDEDGHSERKFLEAVHQSSIAHKTVPAEPGPPKLFKVSDDSGRVAFTQVEDAIRPRLESSDAFILDTDSAVYVWVGQSSSAQEQKLALQYGEKYSHSKGSGAKNLVKVVEGHEPDAFEASFPYSVR